MQLADSSEFKQNPIEEACRKPEQVRSALSPRVKETKRELYVDDEFEENKINIWHRERYAMPLIKLSATVPGPA